MRRIVVTGISGAIGFATAELLLKEGYSVVGVSRRPKFIEERLEAYGDRYEGISADLSSVEVAERMMREIIEKYAPLGGMVYCAGFDRLKPLYLNKSKDYEELWRIHAQVPMLFTSALARRNVCLEGASIVLLSSLAAHEGAAMHSAYAAAKGALEGFLPAAAAELADKKIRINLAVLGVVEGGMSNVWLEKLLPLKKDALSESYPFGLGKPEDAASLLTYLASERSAWISGQKFFADGGHLCRKI